MSYHSSRSGEKGENSGWDSERMDKRRKGRTMLWWNVKGRVRSAEGLEVEVEDGEGVVKTPHRYLVSVSSRGCVF